MLIQSGSVLGSLLPVVLNDCGQVPRSYIGVKMHLGFLFDPQQAWGFVLHEFIYCGRVAKFQVRPGIVPLRQQSQRYRACRGLDPHHCRRFFTLRSS